MIPNWSLPEGAKAMLAADTILWDEFLALCACGGRLTGTASERRAVEFLLAAGCAATGQEASVSGFSYGGWKCIAASLEIHRGGERMPMASTALLRSPATEEQGLTAEVLPLGRGTEDDFRAAASRLKGRIAMVNHEYMFSDQHIHRRRKYEWAKQYGAVGFLIVSPLAGSTVAGSTGRGDEPGIPAMGISPETAALLSSEAGPLIRATLHISTEEREETSRSLFFDVPGQTDEWVVLSAHIDGHALAESAMDNASGLAVALSAARAVALHAGHARRGLRLAFFNAEEWALTGSRIWINSLPARDRARMLLNVNPDTVGGSIKLTALCSDFPKLSEWVEGVSVQNQLPLDTYLPLVANSDHANFAAAGIPALRLVAGFNEHNSNVQNVLTEADTRDKVRPEELRSAAICAATLTWAGMVADKLDNLSVKF
jgi:aminopeptidase YwaD